MIILRQLPLAGDFLMMSPAVARTVCSFRLFAIAPASGTEYVGMLEFDTSNFDSSFFAAEGIQCPADVARSVPKRQLEFFYGRLAARAVIDLFGYRGYDVAVGARREPLWPQGLVGSITHTSRFAAAAVGAATDTRGLGIDIKNVVSNDVLCTLLDTAVDADEEAYLRGLTQRSLLGLPAALTLVYSAKESFFKAAYGSVRRYFNFDAVQLTGLDLGLQRMTLVQQESLSAEFPAGQRHKVIFEFLDNETIFTCTLGTLGSATASPAYSRGPPISTTTGGFTAVPPRFALPAMWLPRRARYRIASPTSSISAGPVSPSTPPAHPVLPRYISRVKACCRTNPISASRVA